jgi:hypothetical protein
MSITLTELRAVIRRQITNATTWPNATLDGWIQDAVRDYSKEFPRRLRKTLTLATGTQAYDLPGGQAFLAVLRVEYPAGQSPPIFLWQADEGELEFQAGGYAYALRAPADDIADELDAAAGKLVLAQTVTTGETVAIEYAATHAVPVAGDDDAIITVPESPLDALVAFVEFRQAAQLNNDARWRQCIANDKLGELSADARMAWERYRSVIDALRAGRPQLRPNRAVWNRLGLEDWRGSDYSDGYRWR